MPQKDSQSAIRHLAPAWQGDIVAAAEFEHAVSLWNVATGEKVSEFETVMDYGGRRLALSQSKSACLAAAYHIYGLACYNTPAGDLRWERKELKKVQRIVVTPDEEFACCCFATGPCQVVDIATGETAYSVRGLAYIWFHPQNKYRLYQSRSYKLTVVHQDDTKAFSIAPASKLLDAAFNEKYLAITQMGADVLVFDLSSGERLALHKQPTGQHVLRLSGMPDTDDFFGVQWSYQKAGLKRLIRFSPNTAEHEVICDIGTASEAEFCYGGRTLLTSDGDVVDCKTGRIERKIQFPTKSVP